MRMQWMERNYTPFRMIHRSKKIVVSSGIATLLVFGMLMPALPVHAQEFPMQSILQAIVGSVSDFLHLGQNTELSSDAIMQQELTARKETVSRIYDLTNMEQADLRARLTALTGLSQAQIKMRDSLLAELQENDTALRQINDRLTSARTIATVQQLAADFKNWRTLVYDPKAARIVAFTFVFNEGPIITTAEQRLANIASDLKLHTQAPDQSSATLLTEATGKIAQAKDLHDQAGTLIMVALATSADFYTPFATSSPATALVARNTSDAKAYTARSLQDIQDAYAFFLKIGTAIH